MCYVAKIACSTGYSWDKTAKGKTQNCLPVRSCRYAHAITRARQRRTRARSMPTRPRSVFTPYLSNTVVLGKTPRLFSCPCSAEAAGTAGWRRRIACMYLVSLDRRSRKLAFYIACLHAISLERSRFRKNAQLKWKISQPLSGSWRS